MRRQLTRITRLVYLAICWVPFISAAPGWQPLAEKINKSPKDARHYQAIKLVTA